MRRDTIEKIAARLDNLRPEEIRQLFLKLAAEKGLLQEVFDALRDGLILFGNDGQPRLANKAACTIYNRPLRDLMRESFDHLAAGACTWQQLRESGVAVMRDIHVNYPTDRHYNFLITPLADEGGCLLLVRDDTEAHEKEEQNAEDEQFNLLTFLTSAVAHEIGNPLNSLGLGLQLIRRKLDKQSASTRAALGGLLDDALTETKRLDTLLHHFLQSMRPTKLVRTTVQVNEVIERVIRLLTPEIAHREASLQTELREDLPEISADAEQLFRALYNLIRNALQSLTGPNGGISVRTSYNDTDIGISIGDNGSGISHEVMGSMYEPFRSTKEKGHGLGLLIVRHIVRQHGGTLSIASRRGLGTTITMTLPRADRMVRLIQA